MPSSKDSLAIALGAIAFGLLFVLIAVFRPAFLWDMGKVRTGREVIGDTGVSIFFAAIGVAMAAAGIFLSRKK